MASTGFRDRASVPSYPIQGGCFIGAANGRTESLLGCHARISDGVSKASVRRKLEEIGETGILPTRLQRDSDRLLPGTVLTRVYDDVEHCVVVRGLRDFEYQGRRFKSLSAVARAIVGCPWSKPVFFGLKSGHKKNEPA